LLPLKEPSQDDKEGLYKSLVYTFANKWDDPAKPKSIIRDNNVTFAFAQIMKMTRNWMVHSKIFNNLSEQEVAYLFISNMRAMFELKSIPQEYENQLFSIFNKIKIEDDEMIDIIGNKAWNRKIPFVRDYAVLLNTYGKSFEAKKYHSIINDLQNNDNPAAYNYINGIYQTFWFLTSPGHIFIPRSQGRIDSNRIEVLDSLKYQFRYYDYGKSDTSSFIFNFSKNIYKLSFGNS